MVTWPWDWRAKRLGEEVVALVVHDDERREVHDVDLPHRFHPELGEVDDLHGADVVLREDRCRTADRAEVEAAVRLAGVGHLP